MTHRLQQLPRRDLERLSAYLDGELSARAAARLEARLQNEPLLRQGMAELSQVTHLLEKLPQAEVPRSFVLTPEMAGQVERGWRYPVMQLATAVAAFTFLVVVGFDAAISQGLLPGAGSAQLAAEAPLAEEVAPLESPRQSQPESGADMEQAEEELQAQLVQPADESLEDSQGEVESEAEAPEAEAQASPLPTDAAEPTSMAEEGFVAGEEERALEAPATATPVAAAGQTSTAPTGAEVSDGGAAAYPIARNLLRWIEIGLAALVVALAGLTLRTRPRD